MKRDIRTLSEREVETLVGWAGDEGWNPGTGDAAAFRLADPDGFIGAFIDGEFVAGISAVAYGTDFGFIGLYISHPDHRGRGHGRSVWDAGMAHLAGRTIGLDGVPEQQANYGRKGFVKAYETIRLTGRPSLGIATGLAVDRIAPEQLQRLDRSCFPAGREAFLEAWIQPPRQFRAVTIDGELQGYGAIRPCMTGSKIGPLFAPSTEIALQLLAELLELSSGPVQIDIPRTQTGFIARLTEAGMEPGFSTARMYRGPFPSVELEKVFGITTLELG